ncbi:hypothetical protein MLD38_005773 [Melastoma candidum]|uniref:Uncharacterized protein n=1 Tax=Melastoma candidum TaxID=119954 RepID=A0ACB9RKH7_9MYRT|nr:hypothetical protein MLD38_005773 [Melastoma candidum]
MLQNFGQGEGKTLDSGTKPSQERERERKLKNREVGGYCTSCEPDAKEPPGIVASLSPRSVVALVESRRDRDLLLTICPRLDLGN